MRFFRYCDFFNIKFHFYYEKKDNISFFGGFMSISYIVIAIMITILLSLDDLKKLNPITTRSEVPDGEFRVTNLKDSKIYIPWRLITYEEKFIDHRGILYPMVTLIEGKLDENIGMNLKTHNLKYTLCNETSMVNITDHYKIDTPLDELYCIEQSDIPFGGSWLSDTLYYLEINLFLCKDGIRYNASDARCTKLPDLVTYTNTTWLFEFFYPIVQFQPTNHEIPMIVIYKNYYYRLTSHTYKLERLYIQENILADDTSLFTSSTLNTSCWGISTIYGDTYFWSEEQDPLVKSNSSVLFSLDIYMDQGYIYYTRSFRKIFTIFSNVFPILNILLIVFEKITVWIKLAFAKQSIVEILFENSKIYKTQNKVTFQIDNAKIKNQSQNPSQKKRNTIYINKRPKFEEVLKISKEKLKVFKFNNINSLKDNLSASKNLPNYLKKTSGASKDESHLELFTPVKVKKYNMPKEKNLSIFYRNKEENSDTAEEYVVKKKGKLFPLFYYFMDVFMNKLERPQTFCCLDKKYLIVYNFMIRIFNISSYILLYKNFNIYKTIFSKEMKDLNFPKFEKKFNISNDKLMDNLEQKIFSDDNKENNEIFSKTIIYD